MEVAINSKVPGQGPNHGKQNNVKANTAAHRNNAHANLNVPGNSSKNGKGNANGNGHGSGQPNGTTPIIIADGNAMATTTPTKVFGSAKSPTKTTLLVATVAGGTGANSKGQCFVRVSPVASK